ncbi:MAG TPA: zinc-binding dehydrogenase, partial [Rhodothermales bacterium]|nr:zinc-binding dehydrogenase [Rhodothermales bacterium]
ELVTAPASCLMAWSENIPAAWAGLAEPLGNGVHVVERVRHHQPESMLIIGAGPIGLMVLQAVRVLLRIPVAVVDVDLQRLDAARSVGAEAAITSNRGNLALLAEDFTGGMGFDVVVDAAGTGVTKSMSIEACRDEGLIVWIGLGVDECPLSTYPVTLREKTITGSYGATGKDMERALAMMADGSVDVSSWVTTYSLKDSADAFLRQLDPMRRNIKAVITIEA